MKLKILAALLLCGGFGVCAWAQCGAGIPSAGNPGCIPPDRPNSPYYNGGGSTPPQPRAIWESRWGAIAQNAKTGEWGSTENQITRNQAEQTAIADCKARTTEGCKILLSYGNECVAFSGREKGVSAVNASSVGDESHAPWSGAQGLDLAAKRFTARAACRCESSSHHASFIVCY